MYTLRLYDITGTNVEATLGDAKIQAWSNRINGPGRLIYALPANSPNATIAKLQKYKRVRLSRRKQDGTGEDEVVWYGYIEAHKRTSPEVYTIYCAGMLQLFKHRYTAKDETFTGQGATEAFGLLTDTNANDGDTGIDSGTGTVTTTKSLKATGRKDILSMWEEIAKASGGEFEIDADGQFNFVPSLGTDKTASVKLIYRTDGSPGNTVDGLEEGEDGAPLRNKVIGVSSDGTLTSTQEDATSKTTYGTLVEVKVFPEAQNQATLDSLTQAYRDQVKTPVQDFGARPILAFQKFNVISGTRDVSGFQYGAVIPGDLITCDIVSEAQTIAASKRVIEIFVEVDDNLKETVQYTLGEEGVFVTVNALATRDQDDVKRRILALEQGGVGSGSGGGGGSVSFVDREAPTGAVNSSNTSFTLAETPVVGSEHVYLNGVLQTITTDYTISGTDIEFTSAPLTGATLRVSYRTDDGSSDFADRETPTGAVNGSNTAFTLANTPTTGSEHVFLNGVLQTGGGVDYSASTNTITFTTAPLTGAVVVVSYRY